MNLTDDLEENRSSQCVVIGDKNRLAQVMRNLISTAIKFTPENGAVAVHGKCHSVFCILSDLFARLSFFFSFVDI